MQSTILQNISNINISPSPAAGMEEEFVRFTHEPGTNPLKERQALTSLGLSQWVPPLDPLEAATIKAFLRKSYLPLNHWNRTVVIRLGKSILEEPLLLSLTRAEILTFLNQFRIYTKAYPKWGPEMVRACFSRDFRERVLDNRGSSAKFLFQGPQIFADDLDRIIADEKARWQMIFLGAVDKILSNSEVRASFLGLQEIDGRRYQRLPNAAALRPEEEDQVLYESDPDEEKYSRKQFTELELTLAEELLPFLAPESQPFRGRFHLPVEIGIPIDRDDRVHLRFGDIIVRWEREDDYWSGRWRIVRPSDNKILFRSGPSNQATIVSAATVGQELAGVDQPEGVVLDSDSIEPLHARIWVSQYYYGSSPVHALVIQNHARREGTWIELEPPATGMEEAWRMQLLDNTGSIPAEAVEAINPRQVAERERSV